jgi:outer membrane protein
MQVRQTVKIAILVAILISVGIAPGLGIADAPKMGTVNFQKIFENSNGGKAVKEQINTEGQRMEQDLQKKAEETKALEERLARDTGVMSKQARDEQRWELERRVDDLNTLKRNYERRIQDLQMRLVNEVRQGVLKVVQEYGQKEGYVMIIEDISVVYAAPNLDITDEILKRYNDYYAKQGSARQGPKE